MLTERSCDEFDKKAGHWYAFDGAVYERLNFKRSFPEEKKNHSNKRNEESPF